MATGEEAIVLRLMIQSLKVAAILVLAFVVLFTTQRAISHYVTSAHGNDSAPITFVVTENETVNQVADNLKRDGLIRFPTYFKLKMRLAHADSNLKAGRFTLYKGMSTDQIISALTTAENVQVITVRFQEGWRTEQYADALVKAGLFQSPDDFMSAIKSNTWNYDFLATRTSNATLEGFLFPDTYQFRADATPEDVINTLLQTFGNKVPKEERDRAQQLGLNFFQVMTIASIVEREAAVDSERPIIASVYYNRIKQNMPLQADPTVQYAMGNAQNDWWPQLQPGDPQKINSPYNTYQSPGLPPGPICNPSLKSIQAALNPANTTFLYFVAKNDGSGEHYFANTLDEQKANIQKSEQNSSP